MSVNSYLITTTLIFLFFAIVWSKTHWRDVFFKVGFWVLTGWGTILLLLRYGYWAIR